MRRILRLILGILLIAIAIIIALDMFAGTNIIKKHITTRNGISINAPVKYKDEEKYRSGNGSVDASKVKNLDINWISGEISFVEVESGKDVSFAEPNSPSNPQERLHWYLDGDTLRIQWSKSGINVNKSKDLIVNLPSDLKLDSITIDAVSADIQGANIHTSSITSNTVSGRVHLNSLDLQNSFKGNSVSGDYTLSFTTKPSSIAFSGVSGSMDLTLPKDTGFTIDMSTVSGNIHNNVPTTGDRKHQTAGNGEVKISFESVSGNATVSYF